MREMLERVAEAKAIISEMREPTEAMIEAGYRVADIDDDYGTISRRHVKAIWQAMNDEAMK